MRDDRGAAAAVQRLAVQVQREGICVAIGNGDVLCDVLHELNRLILPCRVNRRLQAGVAHAADLGSRRLKLKVLIIFDAGAVVSNRRASAVTGACGRHHDVSQFRGYIHRIVFSPDDSRTAWDGDFTAAGVSNRCAVGAFDCAPCEFEYGIRSITAAKANRCEPAADSRRAADDNFSRAIFVVNGNSEF